MKFFYYCFYRISNAYEKLEGSGSYLTGNVMVAGCFGFNILTLIHVFLSFTEKKLTTTEGATFIIVLCVLNLFIMTEKKYNKLSDRWKNEKYKTLKGWLVAGYVTLSFILLFASFYI